MARAALAVLLLTGCSTAKPRNWQPKNHSVPDLSFRLAPGDEVSLRFFGAPDLNATQTVRRDGNITLDLVGDVNVAGMTPAEVQGVLGKQFDQQLQIKEISVTVTSPGPIYVTGAVGEPGPYNMIRPTTALEAVMEAGGFFEMEAEVRNVLVIRREDNKWTSYVVNFKDVLNGKKEDPFYLQPYDVVYVPRTTIVKANQWIEQYISRMIPRIGIGINSSGEVTYLF